MISERAVLTALSLFTNGTSSQNAFQRFYVYICDNISVFPIKASFAYRTVFPRK